MDSPRPSTSTSSAGPSTPRSKPSSAPRTPASTATPAVAAGSDDEDDDDGERPNVEALRSFARQVHLASPSQHITRTKVIIPKRGEKDFEPLDETVNIQGKMLRESREALFDALGGDRGSGSKNISHAILTTSSPYPILKIMRGNMFLTAGHTIRSPHPAPLASDKGKTKQISWMELMPEEALYLLERGSLQIWVRSGVYGSVAGEAEEPEISDEFDEERQGFEDATEMSVMEGYGRFIGMDGLSLERYQVYAGLKRLGYTVQRTPAFLPDRFQKSSVVASTSSSSVLSRIRLAIRAWWSALIRTLKGAGRWVIDAGARVGGKSILLGGIKGTTYRSMFDRIRIIPSGHSHPLTLPTKSSASLQDITTPTSRYSPLIDNPYLPFWHVWKPSTNWSRNNWDRGSAEGLESQPPNFWVAVVDARSTTFPSLKQMDEIFPMLPEVPIAYIRPRAPRPAPSQTPGGEKTATPVMPAPFKTTPASSEPAGVLLRLSRLLPSFLRPATPAPPKQINTYLTLKQGDRSLIVAINDGGNIGWTRLGRGGFEDHVMVQM